MGTERVFLDWNQPALPEAVRYLIERYSDGSVIDLSHVLIVFPGRQAGRRFQELLTIETDGTAIPPRVITVGTLPEFLYQLKRPFATSLTQNLAWAEALQSLRSERLEVVIPQPPEAKDVDAWLSLGEMLSRQHRELAADQLSFEDVAKLGASLEGFNEQQRWQVLAEVQRAYLDRLDALGLWDQQTARLFAIQHQECRSEQEIILVGTVDLNRTLQAMLDQVADRVTALVHAPASLRHCFRPLGNLRADAWEQLEIEIDDGLVSIVDGPQEQAERVAILLEELGLQYAAEDVTVGVPDDRIVPLIERLLNRHGVPTNWVIQQMLPDTGPYLLLSVIATYLEGERVEDFSELVRHPDLSNWLNGQGLPANWLTHWDEYVTTHLQRRTTVVLVNGTRGKVARELVGYVRELLKPLRGGAKPLIDWAGPIREVLLGVYGERELDSELDADRALLQSTESIYKACLEHGDVPEALAPVVTAQQAILLTLEQVRGEFVSAMSRDACIHLSGWLDLPLDDAPVAIVTSMNEGFVPSSVNHDLFLPNRLRHHLGIEDNQRRYARDAYALSAILHSRKEVRLVAARRDLRKEPLTPSRLFFATDPLTVARRVVRFFDEPDEPVERINWGISTTRDESDFHIPRPCLQDEPKRSFRVTEFKDYLTSPYRYYLRHVLRLGEMTDACVELDPAGFGSLMHEVLQEFGESGETWQTDSRQIAAFLNDQLDTIVRKRYGIDPLFPVAVQIEQIRHRLNIFAEWQADWTRQGWEIRFTEIGARRDVKFPLDDGSFITIRGRIDRVDFHEKRNEWIIFDYKTGDTATEPEKTHRFKKQEWTDLQLPLYRHLARPFGVQGKVGLGYITLPRTTTEIREKLADWTEEELLEADAVAKGIARQIINQEFWVELDQPVRWFQEYARICQDDVFGREAYV